MKTIAQAFADARASGSRAFIPYMTAGYPDMGAFMDIMTALDESGADVVEIGLPFSDPMADGAVIQESGGRALAMGMTPAKVLDLVARTRARMERPLVIMTYFNPILQMGLEDFARRACEAGASGVIVPDLPVEEADDWREIADKIGLDPIFMVAPTTTPERLERILPACRGFLYYVSMTGVTGSELMLSGDLAERLKKVRAESPVPVAVGFGVSTPDQARALSSAADGVIVGSALIKAARDAEKKDPVRAVADLAGSIKKALSV